MRTRIFCGILITMLALVVQSIHAQSTNSLITVDENGNGSLTGRGPNTLSLPGIVTPLGLFYSLLNPPSLTPGDVLLLDENGAVSDDIRFGQSNGNLGLYFYSNDNDGDLADGPLPGNLLNTVTIPEGTIYTPPAPAEPGV